MAISYVSYHFLRREFCRRGGGCRKRKSPRRALHHVNICLSPMNIPLTDLQLAR